MSDPEPSRLAALRISARGWHGIQLAVIGFIGAASSGPLFEKIIAPKCDALAELSPDHLVPSHCTGWRAIHAIAAAFPDAFMQNSVGTRFEFTSSR